MKPPLAKSEFESTWTLDLTTSAGNIDTQNATPPNPFQNFNFKYNYLSSLLIKYQTPQNAVFKMPLVF